MNKDGDNVVYSIEVPRTTNIGWQILSFGAAWLLIYGILYMGISIIDKLYNKKNSR